MKTLRKFSSFFAGFLFFPLFASAQTRYDTYFLKPLPQGGVTQISGFMSVCTPLTTTAASVSGNVATLTMSSNPITAGFINGRNVLVVNFTGADTYFNGTFTLTSVTSTQIQFALTHFNAVASSNGGAMMAPSASQGCAPTTNVYSDQSLATVIAQPFSGDAQSNYGFWAAPGTYYVGLSASGVNPIPFNPVTLALTPDLSGVYTFNSPTLVSPTTTGTDSGAETLQNKTFDISANTLKNSSNTSGHVPRNNGTKYVDGQLGFADLSGNASTSQIGSGTPAASKYVDGGTGAWTPLPAAGLTESVIGLGNAAQTSTLVCAGGNAASGCQFFFWANAHTITRLIINVSTAPVGCSTNAVYGLKDLTASSVVTSLTPTSTGVTDSGALSVATTAAHQFVLGLTTAAVGCSTFITANSMSVTFQ